MWGCRYFWRNQDKWGKFEEEVDSSNGIRSKALSDKSHRSKSPWSKAPWSKAQPLNSKMVKSPIIIIQVARVIRTIEHSHDANLERVEAAKIIASMKESAGTRRATPAQLYAYHTQYATAHIRAEIGHQDAVKRTIRREKAKHLPKSPVSLSDLEVTGEWTTTGGVDKEDFLIHDSGPESASRILVFASQSALTHLASADKWYMDGTFDVAPLLFQQLCPVALVPTICVRHGTEDSVVLSEHPTLLYGKP